MIASRSRTRARPPRPSSRRNRKSPNNPFPILRNRPRRANHACCQSCRRRRFVTKRSVCLRHRSQRGATGSPRSRMVYAIGSMEYAAEQERLRGEAHGFFYSIKKEGTPASFRLKTARSTIS
jgi:hypothetical protein